MKLSCGSCNSCCTLLQVPDIGKPAQMRCWHTSVHGGCNVQSEKETDPSLLACHQFKCIWLASQDLDDPDARFAREFRPDMSHVMFGPWDQEDSTLLHVNVDPNYPTAWRAPKIIEYLEEVQTRGAKIQLIIGETVMAYPL